MWLLLISFLIIIIEKGILPSFFSAGFIPQLLLIWVIILAIWKMSNVHSEEKWGEIAFMIFLTGILYDLFSGNYLGFSSLLNLSVFLVIMFLGNIVPGRFNLLSLPLNLIIGTLVYNLIAFLFSLLLGKNEHIVLSKVLIQLVSVNFITGVVCYKGFIFIFERLVGKKELEIN